MKKLITMVILGLMILSSSIAVFAEEPADALTQDLLEQSTEAGTEKISVETLKEFTDELHQINALRIERKQLQIKIIEKQDQLVDLYIEAKEAGDLDILKAAREERKQIKGIHEEIKALHEQAAASREAFRDAKKNNDIETANGELEKLIGIHSSINAKVQQKLDILEDVVEILL